MAELLYRESVTPTVPVSTSVKGTPLTALEIDGNFKSLNDNLATLATRGTGNGTVTSVTSANANITIATATTTPVITLVQTPALQSATTTVNVGAATAPTAGQVLTATSGTTATWRTVDFLAVQIFQ